MIERMRALVFGALATLVASAGCGRSTPPTPTPPGSGGGESITGRERIGWDQQASDTVELATFRYAIYVDGTRSVVAEVSCGATAAAAGFPCSGRLPALSAGAHTLELASFVDDGGVLESARSSALRVTVVASTAPPVAVDWESGHVETTVDGLELRAEKVMSGFEEPIDAAFTPDGRLFIAERIGRVRIVDGDQRADALMLDADEDGGRDSVLSIAIDPDFERTHFVFVVQTAKSSSGAVFRLARYRELRGTPGRARDPARDRRHRGHGGGGRVEIRPGRQALSRAGRSRRRRQASSTQRGRHQATRPGGHDPGGCARHPLAPGHGLGSAIRAALDRR